MTATLTVGADHVKSLVIKCHVVLEGNVLRIISTKSNSSHWAVYMFQWCFQTVLSVELCRTGYEDHASSIFAKDFCFIGIPHVH